MRNAIANCRTRPRHMDWKLLGSTYAAIFFAELGDKTQLATLALATDRSRWTIFAGSALALVTTSALAVLGGDLVARAIPTALDPRGAGALFVVLGVASVSSWRSRSEACQGRRLLGVGLLKGRAAQTALAGAPRARSRPPRGPLDTGRAASSGARPRLASWPTVVTEHREQDGAVDTRGGHLGRLCRIAELHPSTGATLARGGRRGATDRRACAT